MTTSPSPRRRGRVAADLPLALDRGATVALVTQLADQLRAAMRAGVLAAGERLPSTRGLAGQLGVSRTVVTEAYQQLYAEGWLDGRHGSGTYVADLPATVGAPAETRPRPAPAPLPERRRRPAGRAIDLRPGAPWVRDYDRAAWRRAWRRAAELPPSDDPDPYGLPVLREALAAHLRRARAVPVEPDGIMITRGTGNGLDLVAATLLRPGDRAGVEDPGYRVARNVFAARGAQVVPCPVDADGVIVEALPDDLRVLYTTPAHQYPLGGRLPIPRRERLLAWARRTGATIIEDDYDAEFRYDVAPLPALYGLDPDVVVLLGTLSKTLAPDVGVGWLLGRPDLLARIADTRDALADRTSGPVQAAVAVLLERGDLDRHLRRMRLEYARRRAAVVEILGPLVHGDTAGLHVLVELPEEAVGPLAEAARRRGVLLDTTDRHHIGPPRVHGLVLGYGSASPAEVRRGCQVVAELVAEFTGTAFTDTAFTGTALTDTAAAPASAPAPPAARGGRRGDRQAAHAPPTNGRPRERARAR
ncbi:GntR family transcriptional regulator/MocR family aminotransferase [Thermocatellispora tengchongensis]|uniref:GntR family transcriptional regulator/MocR family aminotransferase n=1 Tax=Thermocatellispora tengchongensis TaxID=1073253 RepID=A0A840PA64_9ACTN|nr:PLP-dependent aminotransferase family protein [Thermocatellispora tengchongensis]MBB5136538.1 GntR family transcriptional regulator/MocR family aminotransferase [Thermocatellispora tengchongensis]